MNFSWLRRAKATGKDRHPGPTVDQESGEILDMPDRGVRRDQARTDRPSVTGERTIPSVNRERSVRTLVTHAMSIGLVAVLGSGLLLWFYGSQLAKIHDAQAADEKAAESRAAGEMKLSPLGRIDPPQPAASAAASEQVAADLLGPAPAAPPIQAGFISSSGTAQSAQAKTPAQLALERKLNAPVMWRQTATQGSGAAPQDGHSAQGGSDATGIYADRRVQTDDDRAPSRPTETPLGTLLRSTPTEAVSAQILPTRRLLLPKSTFIDCTLETAIDSTFDGMVTCIGAGDVYSADGSVVLLERGTKYVGEKRGEVKQGQARVFVVWSEARTPTGVVVHLASPGTDELGRTGLPGSVDRHFAERFGAAILVSMIDGTIQALAASQQHGTTGTSVVLNPQGTREVMTEVLKNTIAVAPTVVKNQGDRIEILVARDADFRGVYALRNQPAGQ